MEHIVTRHFYIKVINSYRSIYNLGDETFLSLKVLKNLKDILLVTTTFYVKKIVLKFYKLFS